MVDDKTSVDSDKLVEVYSAANEIEAKGIVNALSDANIEALMQGQHSASFRAEAPSDVKVVVRKRDEVAARSCLVKLGLDDQVDWDQVDVGEPID